MKLILKNIGIINQAEINLNGLTVIAGDNDTGKSFVGRTLFSIIKASNNSGIIFTEELEKKIKDIVQEIYIEVRKNLEKEGSKDLFDILNPGSFIKELKSAVISENVFKIDDVIQKRTSFIRTSSLEKPLMEALHLKLEELRSVLDINNSEEKKKIHSKACKEILQKEFSSRIRNIYTENNGEIYFLEGLNQLLKITLSNGSIEVEYLDSLLVPTATLIETPFILQMKGLLGDYKKYLPVHISDLFEKLTGSIGYFDEDMFLKKIESTIQGDWDYNIEKDDFVFTKEISGKKQPFESINTATGIKSFGIISLLKKAGVLDKRCVLIIDEPEVHLHPKWQVEYAKIITELVKEGVIVLVTTHSPYMVQAFSVFSKEAAIKSDFYLSHKNDKGSAEMENVSEDINKIFLQLSKPLNDIVWGKKYAL
jgi:predicted ATPase